MVLEVVGKQGNGHNLMVIAAHVAEGGLGNGASFRMETLGRSTFEQKPAPAAPSIGLKP